MTLNEALGADPQTRYETIGIIKKKTGKWGKRIAILPVIGMVMSLIPLLGSEANFSTKVAAFFTVLITGAANVVWFYFAVKGYGWGWYWIKARYGVNKQDLTGLGASAGAAASSILSIGMGGSLMGLAGLIPLVIFIVIGVYAGIFSMIRYELEYNRLKKQYAQPTNTVNS